MAKEPIVHYARCDYGMYSWACNLFMCDKKGKRHTLDKSKVTCGSCLRTKIYRSSVKT